MDIVIVGASGGIGRYIFDELSTKYHTYGTYCHGKYPNVGWLHADVTQADDVISMLESMSGLHDVVLINLFGVSRDGMGHKLSTEAWNEVVDTNLKGAFLTCGAFLPIMRAQGWGRIINISSVVGRVGVPGTCAYSASKAGLEGLTRTLAVENATKGITVNCLSLGYFEAGMINTLSPEMRESVVQSIPMKRLGTLHNIEAAIEFLIEADYVTGTTLRIDGGMA